jgi:hypothetical protein
MINQIFSICHKDSTMKLLYGLSFLSLATLISVNAITPSETSQPTLTQLSKMHKCKISFELFCDDEHYNSEIWELIEAEISALVDKCSASPEEKADELFQEIYQVIERIRKAKLASESKGIYGVLNVSRGEPPVVQ